VSESNPVYFSGDRMNVDLLGVEVVAFQCDMVGYSSFQIGPTIIIIPRLIIFLQLLLNFYEHIWQMWVEFKFIKEGQ
jgi:hypothetical protein